MMKRTWTRLVGMTILVFCFNSQIVAQSQFGIIYGIVADAETGETVPFANVAVKSKQGKLITGGTTNLDGEFRVEEIPLGQYTIEISFLGYLKKEFEAFPIKAGKNQMIVHLEQSVEMISICCFCCCYTVIEAEPEFEEPITEEEQKFLKASENKELLRDGYFIYPNPANDILKFQFMEDITSIQLTDLNGKILFDDAVSAYDLNSLVVAGYPAGMYVLRFFTEGKWESKKIIIAH
jgi:hypothetical protein